MQKEKILEQVATTVLKIPPPRPPSFLSRFLNLFISLQITKSALNFIYIVIFNS
jgi:hypothetical protein